MERLRYAIKVLPLLYVGATRVGNAPLTLRTIVVFQIVSLKNIFRLCVVVPENHFRVVVFVLLE